MPKDENWIASQNLTVPLKWRKSRHVVVVEDLFHENVPDEWIDRVFAIMALTPQHTYQVLTKRADRMREYVLGFNCDGARRFNVSRRVEEFSPEYRWVGDPAGGVEPEDERLSMIEKDPDWPLPNVWLGVSAEDQTRADQRIPDLLATPAAVRFVSVEPMLGPVDLERWFHDEDCNGSNEPTFSGCFCRDYGGPHEVTLDWVICGGESGGSARPMHPDWARDLRDQCAAAGVPFFFKQWGEWAPGSVAGPNSRSIRAARWWDEAWRYEIAPPARPDDHIDHEPDVFRIGKKAAGRLLDGVQHDGRPETKGET